MPTCFTVECPAEACYINPLCATDYQNRVVALAFVKKSVVLDKTTATLWLNSLLLAEINGDAVIVRNTSGDKPAPETSELDGFGRSTGRLGPKTHTVTAMDRNGVVNVAAYNAFLQTNGLYDLYFLTPLLIWDASGQEVTINGDPIISNDIKTFITGQLVIKWTQIGNPLACEFDDVSLNVIQRYIIANAYDPSFLLAVTVGDEFVTTFSASLAEAITGSVPDKIWSITGTEAEIDDFGVAIDSVTGVLTVTASNPGTITITVVVTNQYGCITGEQDVVITATEA